MQTCDLKKEYKCFEDIKHIKEDGTEYWFARELAIVLDYNKWENLHKVIRRAMIACENSGHDITCDFPEVRKIVKADAIYVDVDKTNEKKDIVYPDKCKIRRQ